jgi:hypothetical protein
MAFMKGETLALRDQRRAQAEKKAAAAVGRKLRHPPVTDGV